MERHPWNAFVPMEVTVVGIVMLVSAEQLSKAEVPIVFRPEES